MKKWAQTVRVNGIKIRSELPPTDSVYQTVKTVLQRRRGGRLPAKVTIYDKYQETRRGNTLFGRCETTDAGFSNISLYAGSFGMRGSDRALEAEESLLHELDHAEYETQVDQGLFLDGKPSESEIEERARMAEFKAKHY